MPSHRAVLPFLLLGTVVFLLSCAARRPRGAPVPPNAMPRAISGASQDAGSAAYVNSVEGLRKLLNDLLAAARSGDNKTLDALIKETEFPDYGRWFLATYRPDPDTADDWAHVYRDNVTSNEQVFRELLATLAKDNSAEILVRKVNDAPEPNNGLEYGMLQYARAPVDLYSVTLRSSPDAPAARGYFVYVDGMFRWDNISDFAAPNTYLSDSHRLEKGRPAFGPAGQTAGTAKYPNTPDGLHQVLDDLLTAAKNGDDEHVKQIVQQMEIPDYRHWYTSMFVPGSAVSWADPYGKELNQNEQAFEELWLSLGKSGGEIFVRRLIDKPGGPRDMEWGMLHNSREPLDIYCASFKPATGVRDEWRWYFFYLDGMFRWDSTVYSTRVSSR